MVLWLNGSLWNQIWFFYGIAVKKLLSTFIFKSVPARCEEKQYLKGNTQFWFPTNVRCSAEKETWDVLASSIFNISRPNCVKCLGLETVLHCPSSENKSRKADHYCVRKVGSSAIPELLEISGVYIFIYILCFQGVKHEHTYTILPKVLAPPSLEQKNALPDLWQQRWEHNSCI